MSASIISLLGFVIWTVLMVLLIGGYRTSQVLLGKKRANDFPADREHGGPDFYRRLLRVHLNCVENLPIYAAVILTAASLQVTGLTDPYAYPFLALRIGQSSVHLLGTNTMLVSVRFALYAGQLALQGLMLYQILL